MLDRPLARPVLIGKLTIWLNDVQLSCFYLGEVSGLISQKRINILTIQATRPQDLLKVDPGHPKRRPGRESESKSVK